MSISTNARRRPHPATWIAATAVGLAAGIAAALALGAPIEAAVGMMLVTPVLTGLVGTVLGGSQALALRSVLRRPLAWIGASAPGLGAGLALGVVVVEQAGGLLADEPVRVLELSPWARAVSMAVVGAVSGAALGGAQALVLRQEAVGVGEWIRASALGLGVGFPAGSLLVDGLPSGLASPAGLAVFVLVAGAVLGATTARPVVRSG